MAAARLLFILSLLRIIVYMKKLSACLCAFLFSLCVFALPAQAVGYQPSYDVKAAAAYIVNLDTNLIVYDHNSEESLAAASLTKLMTVGLMLDQYQDQLDEVSCTSPRYIYDYLYGRNASSADIRSGETVTMRQLLYAMMLPSGNEAAYIVADYMGSGSVANFVSMMNNQAAKLGCTATHFTDPCGLNTDNMLSARDAYLILRWVMDFDAFREACKTESYDMGTDRVERYSASNPYMIQNTDKMISKTLGGSYYRSYAQGGKTGTLEDWQNFASWHTQDGISYICVVLHAPNDCDPYEYPTKRPALYETGMLMDWVYESLTIQTAMDVNEPLTEIPVRYSTETDTLMLYPADGLATILPAESDGSVTQKEYNLPDSVAAPVAQGDVVGTVTLYLSGQAIGTVDLIAGQDVHRNQVIFVISKLSDFFGGTFFRVFLVLSVITLVIYLVWFFLHTAQNHRHGPHRPRLK